jgi:hypothetical protein
MPIFRRTNCILTTSDIVTLCKRLYGMPGESRLLCILYRHLQRMTIPVAVRIQFVLLKMGMLREECRVECRAVCSHPAYRTAVYRE